MHDEQMDATVT